MSDEIDYSYAYAECPHCGDKIQSRHRHDFHYCSCGSIAIDGGRDYIRLTFTDKKPIVHESSDSS